MGMFNDNLGAHRTGWSYPYKGCELLESASALYKEYFAKEQEARNKMSDFMKDMNISQNDPRIEQTKREIVSFGTLKEQCMVFKHEFKRNPDKVYDLGLGDVTFFNLASE